MGRFIDDGEGHFRIEYRTPLGGIDSSAPPQFIAAHKLQGATNVLIRQGTYTPIAMQAMSWGGTATYNPNTHLIGFGELPFIGTSGGLQYNAAGYFFITATYAGGNATLTAYQGGDMLVGGGAINIGTVTLPCLGTLGRLTFITINQVVYLSAPGLTGICQLNIVPGTITFAFQLTLLTANLGCSFLREMSGRLVAMNVWQVFGGVPTNYPYQIAWSADSQQYGIWNVLDISGNPTGAGFNNLPDCEDVITGAQFTGPTGYIYRQQGITEITGLNSGIQPFNFNHLWASYKGIGTVYSNSLDQYGTEAAFLSDSDVFSFGMSGLASISGTAKQAIYEDLLLSSNNVFGLVCPIQFDSEPEMFYILVMQPLAAVAGSYQTIFWMYSYVTQEWTTLLYLTSTYQPLIDARQMQKILVDGVSNVNYAQGILPVFAAQVTGHIPQFFYLPDPAHNASTTMILVFPVELVAPFRDVTIDGIAVWTPATDSSTITLSINGISYQSIIADGVSSQVSGGYYKSFPALENPANTFQNIGLSIAVNGTAQIGHIVMYGTQTPSRAF
jgi:hypothetical protein